MSIFIRGFFQNNPAPNHLQKRGKPLSFLFCFFDLLLPYGIPIPFQFPEAPQPLDFPGFLTQNSQIPIENNTLLSNLFFSVKYPHRYQVGKLLDGVYNFFGISGKSGIYAMKALIFLCSSIPIVFQIPFTFIPNWKENEFFFRLKKVSSKKYFFLPKKVKFIYYRINQITRLQRGAFHAH